MNNCQFIKTKKTIKKYLFIQVPENEEQRNVRG